MKHLILIGVVVLLAGIIVWVVRRAIKGESGCGCGCEDDTRHER
jgi:hypothetical protein